MNKAHTQRESKEQELINTVRPELAEAMAAADVLNDFTNLPGRMHAVRTALKVQLGDRQVKMIPLGLLDQYVRLLFYVQETAAMLDGMGPLERQPHLRRFMTLVGRLATLGKQTNISAALTLSVFAEDVANELAEETNTGDLDAWRQHVPNGARA